MPLKGKSIIYLILSIAIALITFGMAGGFVESELFLPAKHQGGYVADYNNEASQLSFVRINYALLANNEPFKLNLFDKDYLAIPVEISANINGRFTWRGVAEGYEDSKITMSIVGKAVVGTATIDGSMYKWHYIGNGVQLLMEISPNLPLPEGEPIMVKTEPEQENNSPEFDDGDILDILVVYTPAMEARYGGESGALAFINLAIEETNQAFVNSEVDMSLNLVHTTIVSYTESGNMSLDLRRLRTTNDQYMDEVHALRDTYSADVVAMIEESNDFCGIAYLMTTLGNSFKVSAFSTTYSTCSTGYYSFGHELGHNIGLDHNRQATSGSGVFPYSYGYYNDAQTFRTILSYSCPTGCIRLQYFSNPDVYWNGDPMGISHVADPENSADNAESIRQAGLTITNWRDSTHSVLPLRPTHMHAALIADDHVTVAWADNSYNEDGFYLERKTDVQWELLQTTPADTRFYRDYDIIYDTSYQYRVKAFNNYGESVYSNIITVTTTVGPTPTATPIPTNTPTPSPTPSPTNTPTATPTPAFMLKELYTKDELSYAGSVVGSHLDTYLNDGNTEDITEQSSVGKPKYRYSYLDHVWLIDLPDSLFAELHINAWAPASTDNDEFVFSYSIDGDQYTQLFTINTTYDDESYYTAVLPQGTYGEIRLRVTDTDRTIGNRANDTLFVDHIYITANIPVYGQSHLGNLTGHSTNAPRNRWNAEARVLAHNANHDSISGATISGYWRYGEKIESAACTTDLSGCAMTLSDIKSNIRSAVFTVTNIEYPNFMYAHDSNDVNNTLSIPKP